VSRRHGSKPGNPGQRSAAANPAGGAEARAELTRLHEQLRADKALLDRLAAVDASPAAEILVEQARGRYEQTLERNCELLAGLLAEAEGRTGVLEEENRALRQANDQLTYRADKLGLELRRALGVSVLTASRHTGGDAAAGANADAQSKPEQPGPGKRGAPKGHRGRTRQVPATIDREEVFAPAERCSCGGAEIQPLDDYDVRYVEDIPPICKEVTRQIYLQGRCADCGKVVHHPAAVAGPPVVTGPNLAAHLTMMNHMGVTFRKLSAFSTRTLGIELSPAGVLGIVNRVTAALDGPYRQLLAALPRQDWLNGDETGWKVMGRNGYIWCFCNRHIAVFHHDYSRGAKVIEEILGDAFAGVVVCDFYAAYNCIEKTQRCLVHLLRDIKIEREVLQGSKLLERFEKAVKKFIEDGLNAQAMPEGPERIRAIAKLERQLDRLTRMKVTKGKATTLVKRIDKYRDDLIRFVTHPGVEFHNNRAERQLRPIVVNRKVSFGSNTDHGARRYCVLHSIVETCKLQGLDPIDFIRRAYTSGGLDVPALTGAGPPVAA